MAAIFDTFLLNKGMEDQETIRSFSILTKEADKNTFAWLHNRQPVILQSQQDIDTWLSTHSCSSSPQEVLRQALETHVDFAIVPVTKKVGKMSYQGADCSLSIKPTSSSSGGRKDFFSPSKNKNSPSSTGAIMDNDSNGGVASPSLWDDSGSGKRKDGLQFELSEEKRRRVEDAVKDAKDTGKGKITSYFTRRP